MKAKLIPVLLCLSLAVVAPPFADWWVHLQIQRRLRTRVEGIFVPAFLLPAYTLRRARFQWDEKIKLFSGDLEIRYQPLSLLKNGGFRIHLSGENMEVELLGEWAKIQGAGRAPVRKFSADLLLNSSGLGAVDSLKIDSPAFQFHLGPSKTFREAA